MVIYFNAGMLLGLMAQRWEPKGKFRSPGAFYPSLVTMQPQGCVSVFKREFWVSLAQIRGRGMWLAISDASFCSNHWNICMGSILLCLLFLERYIGLNKKIKIELLLGWKDSHTRKYYYFLFDTALMSPLIMCGTACMNYRNHIGLCFFKNARS